MAITEIDAYGNEVQVPQQANYVMQASQTPEQPEFQPTAYSQQTPQQGQGMPGYVPVTQTQMTAKLPTKEYTDLLADYDKSAANSKAAATKYSEAEAKITDIQAQQLNEMATKMEEDAIARQAKEAQYKAAAADSDKKISEANEAYKSTKIDGMRIFNESNANKVLGAVSLALGSFGSAFTGQKNYAMDIINGIIDRDVEMQKYEAQKKYTAYENAKQERQILDTHFDKEETRDIAAKMYRLEAVKTKFEALALGAKTEQQKAALQVTIAQINQDLLNKKATILQANMPTVSSTTQMVKDPTAITQADMDKANEFKNVIKTGEDVYNKLSKYSLKDGVLPEWLGGKSKEYEAMKAMISGNIVGKIPGLKSDIDFLKIITPMLPMPTDTKGAAQAKVELFKKFMEGNAPAEYVKVYLPNVANKPYQPKTATPIGK